MKSINIYNGVKGELGVRPASTCDHIILPLETAAAVDLNITLPAVLEGVPLCFTLHI